MHSSEINSVYIIIPKHRDKYGCHGTIVLVACCVGGSKGPTVQYIPYCTASGAIYSIMHCFRCNIYIAPEAMSIASKDKYNGNTIHVHFKDTHVHVELNRQDRNKYSIARTGLILSSQDRSKQAGQILHNFLLHVALKSSVVHSL